MEKKLIILLLPIKIREFDFYRYDLNEFKVYKNYDIEAHEIIDYIYPNFSKIFTKKFSSKKIKKFNNFKKWENHMLKKKNNYKNNILVFNETKIDNFRSLRVNFFLKKLNFKTLSFSTELRPPIKNLSLLKKINWILKNLVINKKKIFIIVKNKIFNKIGKFLKLYPMYFLKYGNHKISTSIKNNSKIINVNSRDYNMFLKSNKRLFKKKKRFAIFLDSPVPVHNRGDLFLTGDLEDYKGTKKNWLESLNNFFDIIESQLKLKVLIAPHPKLEYASKKLQYYGNRKLINQRLPDISKECSLIISRDSSGAVFAAINKIPNMFIYTNELNELKNSFLENQKKFANSFGLEVLNINAKISKKKLMKFMKFKIKCYNNYIKKYCTNRTDKKANYEIISNFFNNEIIN